MMLALCLFRASLTGFYASFRQEICLLLSFLIISIYIIVLLSLSI